MIARYQCKLSLLAIIRNEGRTSTLLIDWDDDVIVAENVIPLCPAFDSVVVDSIPPLRVLGETLKELRSKEVHAICRNLKLIVEISDTISQRSRLYRIH